MEKITINHPDIGKVEYIVYTKEEADEAKIKYYFWQVAKQGQWAITDDDFVAKIIKRKHYEGKKRGTDFVQMPFGFLMFNLSSPTTKFKAAGRENKYHLSGKSKIRKELETPKGRDLALAYTKTFDRDLAIDIVFPGGIDPNRRRTWKRQMKTETFRNMIREELEALLKEHGLTESYTLDLLKQAIIIAKSKKDVSGMLKAVENLQSLHGMRDKRLIKDSMRLEATESRQMIDDIKREERKLIATKTITREDDANN